MNYSIQKELDFWDNRVIYNVQFREDTKAPLYKLDEYINQSLQKFIIISANSEAMSYKIGRYFVSKGIKNSEITFIDGFIIKSFIGGDDGEEWQKRTNVDKFFDAQGDDMDHKWVIMPCIDFPFSPTTATYFLNRFKSYKATGIIFYSEGPENLTKTLVSCCHMGNFYQFPKADFYAPKKKQLMDDGY